MLGLDVGTSSVRAALFDGRGREVTATGARVPRAFRTTRAGGAESDAAELIAQVETVIDAALARAPVGALAASPVWTQIIADVLGRPIKLSHVVEASSRGAVLLALETLGAIANLISVPFPPSTQIFIPNAAHHARYRAGLARQQQAYKAIISRVPDNI